MHTKRYIHRDIKPSNILINPERLQVKLADFGLARIVSVPFKALTHEVETLWYRAPEILLGLDEYCLGIDTWPIGLIMAELFNLKPFITGDSEID